MKNGTLEILITNVFDLTGTELSELYCARWGIETEYNVIKNKIQMENFSGKTLNSVLQDFWVSITLADSAAIAAAEAFAAINERSSLKKNKYEYKPNISQLIGSFKNDFVKACMNPASDLLDGIMYEIKAAVVPVRPGRSFPRKKGPKKKQYPMNGKSNI